MIELPRRKFLTILTGVIAAPAVIKADSLMRVRSIAQPEYLLKSATEHWAYGYEEIGIGYKITRTATIPPIVLDAYNRVLAESLQQTKEIYAANMLEGIYK